MKARGVVCTSSLRWWLVGLAYRLGPDAAARQVGVSRRAVADVCAGFEVWPTIEAKIEAARAKSFAKSVSPPTIIAFANSRSGRGVS